MSDKKSPANLNAHYRSPAAQFVKGTDFTGNIKHLAIVAHADDAEIGAMPGIAACYEHPTDRFGCVVTTDGRAAPRKGRFVDLTDEQMIAERIKEQKVAAEMGKYGACLMLGYDSAPLKKEPDGDDFRGLVEDLKTVLAEAKPEVLYLHSIFDEHATHRRITRAALTALQEIASLDPSAPMPQKIYGVKVWGTQEWGPDEAIEGPASKYWDQLPLTEEQLRLQERLIACHVSRQEGARDYAHGTVGEEVANATFAAPRKAQNEAGLCNMLDMTPLLSQPVPEFAREVVEEFARHKLAIAGECSIPEKVVKLDTQPRPSRDGNVNSHTAG